MRGFSFTGTTEFFLLALALVYWTVDVRTGVRLGIALMISVAVNWLLKLLFHGPRPYWLDARVVLYGAAESSFGIPSGHAQNSVVFWGVLAQAINRWWAWGVAIALITAVGLSRVYLGVHFPSDVVAGWLVGLLILLAFFRCEAAVLSGYRALSFPARSLLTFAVTAAAAGIGWVVAPWVAATWPLPAAWAQQAAAAGLQGELQPSELGDLVTVTGAFCGLVVGADWLSRRGGFSPAGPWPRRAARYLVGMAGALIIWQGLGRLADLWQPAWAAVDLALRYVRYALLAGWITALAPLLFLRWHLAEPAPMESPQTDPNG
jgi:hypothetical protein